MKENWYPETIQLLHINQVANPQEPKTFSKYSKVVNATNTYALHLQYLQQAHNTSHHHITSQHHNHQTIESLKRAHHPFQPAYHTYPSYMLVLEYPSSPSNSQNNPLIIAHPFSKHRMLVMPMYAIAMPAISHSCPSTKKAETQERRRVKKKVTNTKENNPPRLFRTKYDTSEQLSSSGAACKVESEFSKVDPQDPNNLIQPSAVILMLMT